MKANTTEIFQSAAKDLLSGPAPKFIRCTVMVEESKSCGSNKYAATCARCGETVPAGEGHLIRGAYIPGQGRWSVYHGTVCPLVCAAQGLMAFPRLTQ